MRFYTKFSVLFIVGVALSAPSNAHPETEGMPSKLAWGNMLVTSSRAFTMARCAGGCRIPNGVPTDDVWNAVLEEDRIEIRNGTASPSQLGIDLQIGQLLPQARKAISANDTVKINDIGSMLQANLNKRMAMYTAFENAGNQRHPFKAIPDLYSQTHPSRGQGSTASPNCVVVQGQGWTGCAPQ